MNIETQTLGLIRFLLIGRYLRAAEKMRDSGAAPAQVSWECETEVSDDEAMDDLSVFCSNCGQHTYYSVRLDARSAHLQGCLSDECLTQKFLQ